MPIMDGRAFGRAYRARDDAAAHLIVMTVDIRTAACAEIRPVEIVSKPFDLEQPLLSVERWVRAHPSRPG